MHELMAVMMTGWLAWISPFGVDRWAPLGQPFETKDACVEMLLAAARAQPEWLNEMQITCRPEGTTPNPPDESTSAHPRPGTSQL